MNWFRALKTDRVHSLMEAATGLSQPYSVQQWLKDYRIDSQNPEMQIVSNPDFISFISEKVSPQYSLNDFRRDKEAFERSMVQPVMPGSSEPSKTSRGNDSRPSWRRDVSPKEFIEARSQNARSAYLSPLKTDDLDGCDLIFSEDGKAGAVVTAERDIQNIFNNGMRNGGKEAIIESIKRGGITLDCFDGYLRLLYSQFGFVETGRVKFNREFAPKDWNHEADGEPDIVFL